MKLDEIFEAEAQIPDWAEKMFSIIKQIKKDISFETLNGEGEVFTEKEAEEITTALKNANYKVEENAYESTDYYVLDSDSRGLVFEQWFNDNQEIPIFVVRFFDDTVEKRKGDLQ